MEIHLYALCWNEADILPFFFRHYDPFVSRYFIFDDGSTDGSLDWLHARPNVEVYPFIRSDPDCFTLSEMSLSNEVWKSSRGRADWVIVTDVDEHLFHPDLTVLVSQYKALGITIVPALGYQMISEEFPHQGELLCETRRQGAVWEIYCKLSVFDPNAITEINYGAGRHGANPSGRVIAPARDELLLLHYKFLGFERTHYRHEQQRCGLGIKDFENGWAYQYSWSQEDFKRAWRGFAQNAIDIRTETAIAAYPAPRWWDSFRSGADFDPGSPNKRQTAKGKSIVNDVAAALSPVSFWVPHCFCPSAWIEHAPFAFWICEALRPRRFIELGTHYGYSYFAFCQAIARLGLGTAAYAVDTWKGDEHAGFYDEDVFQSVLAHNNQRYSGFSTLIRSTFAEALEYFDDHTVDLLHLDGRHFYDDVKNDFTIWRPKLSENAVVLFHDTDVRDRGFGVWKFYDELASAHPSFQFFHGYGLGIVIFGQCVPPALAPLIEAPRETADQIRAVYASARQCALGARAALGERDREVGALRATLARHDEEHAEAVHEIEAQRAQLATISAERDRTVAATTSATGDSPPAEIIQRADALVAAIQTARAELTNSWFGRELLRTGPNGP